MTKELLLANVKCDEKEKKCKALYGDEKNNIEIIGLNPLLPNKNALQNEIEWENKLKRTMVLMEHE